MTLDNTQAVALATRYRETRSDSDFKTLVAFTSQSVKAVASTKFHRPSRFISDHEVRWAIWRAAIGFMPDKPLHFLSYAIHWLRIARRTVGDWADPRGPITLPIRLTPEVMRKAKSGEERPHWVSPAAWEAAVNPIKATPLVRSQKQNGAFTGEETDEEFLRSETTSDEYLCLTELISAIQPALEYRFRKRPHVLLAIYRWWEGEYDSLADAAKTVDLSRERFRQLVEDAKSIAQKSVDGLPELKACNAINCTGAVNDPK